MLRKILLQNRKTVNGNNKRAFSSLTKRQVLKHNGKSHNWDSTKRFYSSSGSSGNGTKLNSTILNYPTEDVLSIGLSVLALKLAYDFVYGEKKKEEEPPVEEPKIDEGKEESKLEEPKVGDEAKELADVETEAKAAEEPNAEETDDKPAEESKVEETEDKAPEEPKVEETDVAAPAESEKAVSDETAVEAAPVKSHEETKSEDSEESKETSSVDAISEGAIDASAAGPAYNPETGEINWDCPCLGGMAHGPCGEEFKDAFSCFIYSEAEPKGVDCIEKFQGMQECFKKHPEIYAEQLKDEEAGVVPATNEEAAATTAGEEAVSVGDVEEVINEQVVPVVDEIVTEEIIPVVEEKIVPAVETIVDANLAPADEVVIVFEEPESIEELVDEGLPINAED